MIMSKDGDTKYLYTANVTRSGTYKIYAASKTVGRVQVMAFNTDEGDQMKSGFKIGWIDVGLN